MTGRLCPSPRGGCEEPVQRAEQPHSLATHWLRALSSGGRVVMLAGQGLVDPREPRRWLLDNPGSLAAAWRLLEPLQRLALQASRSPEGLAATVAQLLRNGSLSRLIYFGVDGAAARMAPDGAVVEVYGSVLRARCPRCGRRLALHEATASPPRCPACGAAMEPELVWRGERPRSRILGEAVYEATTADLIVACCLGGETLPTVLALSAKRFTRLALLGEDKVLAYAADYRVPRGEAEKLLKEVAERASQPHSPQ